MGFLLILKKNRRELQPCPGDLVYTQNHFWANVLQVRKLHACMLQTVWSPTARCQGRHCGLLWEICHSRWHFYDKMHTLTIWSGLSLQNCMVESTGVICVKKLTTLCEAKILYLQNAGSSEVLSCEKLVTYTHRLHIPGHRFVIVSDPKILPAIIGRPGLPKWAAYENVIPVRLRLNRT